MSTPASTNTTLQVIRAAQSHHLAISAMADVKASFLLAASLITLAMVIPQAVHDVKQHTLLALSITAFLSSLFAIKALAPRLLVLRQGNRAPELNLLFCGHFADLDENDYVQRLVAALSTDDGAIDTISRDLYQMGLILHHKKQKAVATAYTVCVIGLIATATVAMIGMAIK
jgi:hypothetical protein